MPAWRRFLFQGLSILLGWGMSLCAVAATEAEQGGVGGIGGEAEIPVVLQLKWTHAFQFAGYYAAEELGFYRQAGLAVQIKAARPGMDTVTEVVSGRADFGIGTSSLLLARANGQPVVVLATIFQHSPLVLVTRREKGTESVHDLAGKRVMLEPQSDELIAYLRREGLGPRGFERQPHTFHSADLITGKVAAMSAYATNEPFFLDEAGFPYQVYSPRSAGVDFYGDNLFTSSQQLADHPERVRAFRAASLRGWDYAMTHPQEVIEIMLRRFPPPGPLPLAKRFLAYEAEHMVPLVRHDLVPVGYTNPGRWRHIADTLAEIGLLSENFSLEGFLYDPAPREGAAEQMVLYRYLAALLTLILLFGGSAAFVLSTNRRLAQSVTSIREAQSALAASEAQFRALADSTTAGIFVLDGQRFRLVNPAMARLSGYGEDELRHMGFDQLVHPDHRQAFRDRGGVSRAGSTASHGEIRIQTKDGESRWLEISTAPVGLDRFGADDTLIGTAFDVTERHRVESELRASRHKFRTLTEGMKDVVWTLDAESLRFLYVSPSVYALRGYTPDEILAAPLDAALTLEGSRQIRALISERAADLRAGHITSETHFTNEMVQPCKNGGSVWTEVITHYVQNEETGRIEVHGVTRDISERKRAEEQVRYLAQHDPLTGLPNRALFADRVAQALAAQRRDGTDLALVFMDLDRFKPINDLLGHAVGDLLLKQVAERVRNLIRETDTVARIGGDEFMILLRAPGDEAETLGVAEKIRCAVASPYTIEGHTLEVSASLGIARAPQHGDNLVVLTQHADEAMYEAKSRGRNAVVLYQATEDLATEGA